MRNEISFTGVHKTINSTSPHHDGCFRALSSLDTPDNDPGMSRESQPRHVLRRGVTGARAKDVGSDGGTMLGNDYEDGSAPDNCGGNTFRGFIVNMCIKVIL